jgi:DNA-binding MarR family transcriptional regulator
MMRRAGQARPSVLLGAAGASTSRPYNAAPMPTHTPSSRASAASTPPAASKPSAAAKPRAARGAEGAEPFDLQSDSLGYAIRRAQVRAYELFFEMVATPELSPARVTALSLISMEPDISQAVLAKRLDIAGPSALKLVDALEDAGLISRNDVAGDRRRYSLALTATGRKKLAALQARLAEYEARLAARLSAQERAQLKLLLQRVAESE